MTATLGEIGLPAIRMHMEENLQGAPVLCVMAQADNHPRLNSARNAFEGPGVLMLEDLDLWEAPVVDADDDLGGFVYATLSRGAREAINLIRSAVENPDVFVIASASDGRAIDGFFYDLLEPLTVVDIDYPDEDERRAIWLDILHDHPSMRGINLDDLVEFSAGMPRYDLYMAAREAIEDAYKTSLMHRNYVPVTTDNLFEKLAAYQPLDSKEYHALENAVVREFSRGPRRQHRRFAERVEGYGRDASLRLRVPHSPGGLSKWRCLHVGVGDRRPAGHPLRVRAQHPARPRQERPHQDGPRRARRLGARTAIPPPRRCSTCSSRSRGR